MLTVFKVFIKDHNFFCIDVVIGGQVQKVEAIDGIIPLLGHRIATWYAMSRYLVKLTKLGAWRYSDPIVIV